MANLAVIGFEYSHTVQAFDKALDRLALENTLLTPVIWTARNGIEQEVLNFFPSCVFLDGGKGWHGEYRTSSESGHYILPLNDLEKKHFSYTHSRTTYLRDPSRINKEDIIFYEEVVRFCYILLKKKKVSLCIFTDYPHSLLDVGMLYAANRLGVCTLVRDGNFVSDFNFPSLIPFVSLPVNSYPVSMQLIYSLEEELRNRDMRMNLDLPDYIAKPNKMIVTIPIPKTYFFHQSIVQRIYSYLRSKYITLFLSKLLRWTMKIICALYLIYIEKFIVTRSVGEDDKNFILVLLHFHPERSTSTMALDTPFEDERIVKLAKSFPDKTILLREHPVNIGNPEFLKYRSWRALKKITKYPNVKYMFPGDRGLFRNLIQRSLFTISTSGSVVLESIQLGVPCVHMSNSFARGFPGVYTADDIDKIDLLVIDELRKKLNSLTKNELNKLCIDELSRRPMILGHINSYHSLHYSSEELINNAADIIYSFLSYAVKASPESKGGPIL